MSEKESFWFSDCGSTLSFVVIYGANCFRNLLSSVYDLAFAESTIFLAKLANPPTIGSEESLYEPKIAPKNSVSPCLPSRKSRIFSFSSKLYFLTLFLITLIWLSICSAFAVLPSDKYL